MSKTWKTPAGTELPIMNLRGQDYLEVKYRVLWFREERPTWTIETRPVELTQTSAFFQATIRDESGKIMSTGHKYEDKQGFADFREKSETSAIGRALALVGYGTQFTGDELDEGDRIVDAPVAKRLVTPDGRTIIPKRIEQPGPDDGVVFPEDEYKIEFGQWKSRTIADVCNDPKFGPKRIDSYITYLEEQAAKKGVQIDGTAKRFIEQASRYLGAMENREPGGNG